MKHGYWGLLLLTLFLYYRGPRLAIKRAYFYTNNLPVISCPFTWFDTSQESGCYLFVDCCREGESFPSSGYFVSLSNQALDDLALLDEPPQLIEVYFLAWGPGPWDHWQRKIGNRFMDQTQVLGFQLIDDLGEKHDFVYHSLYWLIKKAQRE